MRRLKKPAWSGSEPPPKALPDPERWERLRGEGNPHPARVRLRNDTENAIGIGDVVCPVHGCVGMLGKPCAPVVD